MESSSNQIIILFKKGANKYVILKLFIITLRHSKKDLQSLTFITQSITPTTSLNLSTAQHFTILITVIWWYHGLLSTIVNTLPAFNRWLFWPSGSKDLLFRSNNLSLSVNLLVHFIWVLLMMMRSLIGCWIHVNMMNKS